MLSVYLETTVPSYLAGDISPNLLTAAHQQLTQQWWHIAKERFTLFVSDAVIDEIAAGDVELAERRRGLVEGLPVLAYSRDVEELVTEYTQQLGLSGSATADLPHFAYAVAYEMDYLVTWNCAHIANGQVIRRLALVNQRIGRPTPIIVTPEELIEAFPGGVVDE